MRLCIFCGSRMGKQVAYAESAVHLGQALARRGIGVVYGGANTGLMGAMATAALEAGGEVIGVVSQEVVRAGEVLEGVTELRVVDSMLTRKLTLLHLADGFIALPGGYGTLEEVFEVVAQAQAGLHRKPCGLLNVAGYYDPLLAFLDRAVAQGFIPAEHRALLIAAPAVEPLLDRLVTLSGRGKAARSSGA